MAPEIFNGQTTTASDVFSFGMLMTELYTGLQPWLFEEGHFKPNPAFFQKLDEEAPEPYKKLSHSCIEMDPKERPAFSELMFQLQSLFDEESSGVHD
jgi:serine/threonine protein kinase